MTHPAIQFSAPLAATVLLDRAVSLAPQSTAMVSRSGRMTYAELDQASSRVASSLQRMGVHTGDRVAVALANDEPLVVIALAVWKAGAIFVGIPRVMSTAEKLHVLRDSVATLLVADRATSAAIESNRSDVDRLSMLVVEPEAEPGEWSALVDAGDRDFVTAVDPLAIAAIAYTSGTTGVPKGVMHSQHNVFLPGAITAHRGSITADEPMIVINPMTTLNTMITSVLTTLPAMAKCVLGDRHDAVSIAALIEQEQVVCLSTVPTIYYDLLTNPAVKPSQLASLTNPRVGGAPMSEAMKELFASRFGIKPTTSYALTEAPTLVSRQDLGAETTEGACGFPLPHISVEILDDGGQPVPTGEAGEICFGPQTNGPWAGVYRPMLGYWGRPEETAAAMRNGLVRTGDIGKLNEFGELFILERRSQMIIRGGSNIYPSEVERAVIGDDDVLQCCVVPRPDDRLGEIVVAFVEPVVGRTIDLVALEARCRRELAVYKVPSEFHVVAELPKTPLGKVNRTKVAALLADHPTIPRKKLQ